MKTGFMDVISSDEKVLGHTCALVFVSRIGSVVACESFLQMNENNSTWVSFSSSEENQKATVAFLDPPEAKHKGSN